MSLREEARRILQNAEATEQACVAPKMLTLVRIPIPIPITFYFAPAFFAGDEIEHPRAIAMGFFLWAFEGQDNIKVIGWIGLEWIGLQYFLE